MIKTTPLLSEEKLQELIASYEEKGIPLPQFTQEALEALYAFGFGCYQSGHYSQAIHYFRFLTVLDTENGKYWMGLAASYQMTKSYALALQSYAYASLLKPTDPLPHFHAAECCLSIGDHEKALAALNAAELTAKGDSSLLTRILLIKSGLNQPTRSLS